MNHRRGALALPVLLSLASCGGEASRGPEVARPVAPPKAAQPSPSPAVALPPDRPLTPAKLTLMTEFALAPPIGFPQRHTNVFPLGAQAVGYIDATGARMLATLQALRRVSETQKLRDLCVADDGKTTMALWSPPQGGGLRLGRADTFDGPLKEIGRYLYMKMTPGGVPRMHAVTDDKTGTFLTDCKTGSVERIGPPASAVWEYHHDESGNFVLRVQPASGQPASCLARTRTTPWTQLPECNVQRRQDGTIQVDTYARGRPSRCSFVLNTEGQRLPCKTPVGPPKERAQKEDAWPAPNVQNARFYAPSKLVMPLKDGALYALPANGNINEARRLGSDSLLSCEPLLLNAPLFRCTQGGSVDVVVSINAQGNAQEEMLRARRDEPNGYEGRPPLFHVTADGGVAVGGDCDGSLGDVVCVRTASGAWKNVPFSKELVTALARTAPATTLVPSADGRLYVATGTADSLLGGSLQVLVFRADQGPAIKIEKIPTWILTSLSELGGGSGGFASLLTSLSGLGGGSGAQRWGSAPPTLSWRTDQRVRLWPMGREHPAFHTTEFCGLDVHLSGGFEADCVQGRLFSVGRFGLWGKRAGQLQETLDAGVTWKPVALPEGTDTLDVVCMPIGCRIGPYFRMGWGS